MKSRIKVVQGGTSAGKTIAILAILIDRALKTPNLEISVVSNTFPQLRKGAIKDFLKIMEVTGRFNPRSYTKDDHKYVFANGSYIEFFSVENEAKVRGARRHILFVNEGNRIRFDTYHQLRVRTSKDIYIDFNPTARFWAHDEVDMDSDASLIKLTYKENESRPESVDAEMERAKKLHDIGENPYWVNFWRVFGIGEIGSLQGAIWTDWRMVADLPKDENGRVIADLLGFGLDFGYSISSTAVIAVYKFEGHYYFDQWIHETKLSNKDIAQNMLAGGYSGELVYCDSSEPKSIDALRREGINAHPCASKTDIRDYAIDKIGQKRFFITERSKEAINDIRNYVWSEDKTGSLLPKPKKENDHAPDAMIYFIGTEDKYDGTY